MLEAILWDVDGTLAETERDGHRVAFNQAFETLHLPWRWDEHRYGELLAVSGGLERLLYDMQRQENAPVDPAQRRNLAERAHHLKNQFYADIIATGAVPLRGGVAELIDDCVRVGLAMGIVTTTSRCNVSALLSRHLGRDWTSMFAVIVCAEEAPRKKPDPQAYDIALRCLKLESTKAVAIEDAPAGVAAAQSAGVSVMITRSRYFAALEPRGVLAVGPSLAQIAGWNPAADRTASAPAQRIDLGQIERWHAHSPPRRRLD